MPRTDRHSLLMFLWLVLGYAIAHVVVAAWLGAMIESVWQPDYRYENVEVMSDGEPLVRIYSRRTNQYRTLDGELVSAAKVAERNSGRTVSQASIGIHPPSTQPSNWSQRLLPLTDGATLPVYWYAVLPQEVPGTMYFAGYDSRSRRLTGYLSAGGFTALPPSVEQFFPIRTGPSYYPFIGAVKAAAISSDGFYSHPQEPAYEALLDLYANAPGDAVWVLSRNVLYEIRLRSQTMRTLKTDLPEEAHLSRATFKRDDKTFVQLLVRSEAELLIIDPETTNTERLALGPSVPKDSGSYMQTDDGLRLLHTQSPLEPTASLSDSKWRHQLTWYDASGSIVKQAETVTQNPVSQSAVPFTTGASLVCPTPIAPLVGLMVGPWVVSGREAQFAYSARLGIIWNFVWGWLLTTSIISLVIGWACRRRERDVFDNASWLWPILVGGLGWFGWMAYICLRPLPARLPHGRWMPTQPDPNRPLGTEVFA